MEAWPTKEHGALAEQARRVANQVVPHDGHFWFGPPRVSTQDDDVIIIDVEFLEMGSAEESVTFKAKAWSAYFLKEPPVTDNMIRERLADSVMSLGHQLGVELAQQLRPLPEDQKE